MYIKFYYVYKEIIVSNTMTSWVLVLLANEPYIERAKKTITECRFIGDWQDDIVLMVPRSLISNSGLVRFASERNVQLFELPAHNCDAIINVWMKNKGNRNYDYMMSRTFIFMKFYIFDVFFKKWDVVFAMDAGMHVFNRLHIFKEVCQPDNIIYAHSDAYPTYVWRLRGQFSFEMLDTSSQLSLSKYSLDIDYFQSGVLIYDTRIIEAKTVDGLFRLAEQFPSARGDQAILNLYFNCERGLWRQIPLRNEDGFLYDSKQRAHFMKTDYRLLKWI